MKSVNFTDYCVKFTEKSVQIKKSEVFMWL